jgi:hypothetical protein
VGGVVYSPYGLHISLVMMEVPREMQIMPRNVLMVDASMAPTSQMMSPRNAFLWENFFCAFIIIISLLCEMNSSVDWAGTGVSVTEAPDQWP